MPNRLGPRRHLPGRQIPDQDGKRAPRHGITAQPGHQPPAPGRPHQHRRRQPPPRPRPAANTKAASDRMSDFAVSLAGAPRWDCPWRCGSRTCGSRLPWTTFRDAVGSHNPIYVRPAAGARRAASPGSRRTPHPSDAGEPISTAPRAIACHPAGNGPGRPDGARPRSRAAAPATRRPWTPHAGPAPSGCRAGNARADRRPRRSPSDDLQPGRPSRRDQVIEPPYRSD
jgi:hypothetical protein